MSGVLITARDCNRSAGAETIPAVSPWYGLGQDTEPSPNAPDLAALGMARYLDELSAERPFEPAFFEAMIDHHKGGVAMAERVLREEDLRPEAARLALSIVQTQQIDIARMERFLRREDSSVAPRPSGAPTLTP